MDFLDIEEKLLNCDTPPAYIINQLSNCYDGFNILNLYDTLAYYGKLRDELPYAKLYKELNEDERFVTFIAHVGIDALADSFTQTLLLEGDCEMDVLGSLSALNEYYETLKQYTSEGAHEKKMEIIDKVLNSNCPLKLIPSSMLEDYDFVSSYCKTNWDFENEHIYTNILKATKYSKKYEEELLESLNIPSLESYLSKAFNREKDCRDSTKNIDITHIVVAKLYTLKLLAQHKTSITGYSHNPYVEQVLDKNSKLYGCYYSDRDLIELFPFLIPSLKELVVDSSHEAYHAIQKRNILQGDIKRDSDVDVYSMDQYLKEILGNDYYDKNYNFIATEYDAEIKARIDVSKLSGPDVYSDELCDLMDQVATLSKENSRTLDAIMTTSPYSFLLTRLDTDDNRYHLFRLFEKVVNEQLQKADNFDEFRQDLITRFPIFEYMLNITPSGISIKKPSDYINDLETANKVDTGIYLHLISNNLHPIKYPRHKEIKEEYLEAIKKSSLSSTKKTGILICLDRISNKYEQHYMSNRGVN